MTPEKLFQLRRRLKLKQRGMADLLGVSLATYSLYELGKKPISKPVDKLADKYEMDAAEILANPIVFEGD